MRKVHFFQVQPALLPLRREHEEGAVNHGPFGRQKTMTRLKQAARCHEPLQPLLEPGPIPDVSAELMARLHLAERARDKALAALQDSEERYALLGAGAHDGLWDWKISTDEIRFSERWLAMLGVRAEDLAPGLEGWMTRMHPEDRPNVRAQLEAHLEGRQAEFEAEHRIHHQNGSWIWVLTRGRSIRDAQGVCIRMAGSQSDIRDRKGVERELQYMAYHDALTGLPNRDLFMKRLQCSVERSRLDSRFHYAVLVVDLDRFKNINEGFGHDVGDLVLAEVAKRMGAGLRSGDLAARLSGDGFAVLLENVSEVEVASGVAERILASLQRPVFAKEEEIFTGGSIGIAMGDPQYEEAGTALRDADTALYTAKQRGRGRFHVFDAAQHVRAVSIHQLEADLHRAVEKHEFYFVYQPIIRLETGRIAGFEALLRWNHPSGKFISPSEFIPLAEETGLIHPIWRHMLNDACLEAARWQSLTSGEPGPYVSINLSPYQLLEADVASSVEAALRDSNLPSDRLKLEITESAFIQDAPQVIKVLETLVGLGVTILLDDFGTGFASLSQLHTYPIQVLKIDKSFVDRLEHPEGDDVLVKAIIALAGGLSMEQVVAEGIESQLQAERLRAMGCSHGQGYHFARPLMMKDVPEVLARLNPTSVPPLDPGTSAQILLPPGVIQPSESGPGHRPGTNGSKARQKTSQPLAQPRRPYSPVQ